MTLVWTVSLTLGLEVLTNIEAAIAGPGLRPVAEFNRKTYANQLKKKPLRALTKQAILNFSYF